MKVYVAGQLGVGRTISPNHAKTISASPNSLIIGGTEMGTGYHVRVELSVDEIAHIYQLSKLLPEEAQATPTGGKRNVNRSISEERPRAEPAGAF